ncbi:hypothetical protein [Nitratiruptor sp. YY09-18]|uniref:hypothetical protein n=1 Tax=Nitratiruptor sp. YY09-18 TaxID=2724901 RepID=UPI001916BC2E|nr:hypothetical protein [Nitratiruptor sp. YY09-18]
MRRAISMLTAIIFIMLVGVILALTISSLTSATKNTTDTYFIEQEEALAKSATEYAILAAQGHNFATSCLNNINISFQNTYDINITIYYIGNGLPANCNIFANNIVTNESNGTAIIDTRVSLKPNIIQDSTPISYFRRTIQKL